MMMLVNTEVTMTAARAREASSHLRDPWGQVRISRSTRYMDRLNISGGVGDHTDARFVSPL